MTEAGPQNLVLFGPNIAAAASPGARRWDRSPRSTATISSTTGIQKLRLHFEHAHDLDLHKIDFDRLRVATNGC